MPRFTSPPARDEFNLRVWEQVKRIPPGMVSTYGRIAALLGPPPGMDEKSYLAFGARWVGGAMAACPDEVPWWRVINSKGEISPRPGGEKQRELLETEGVVFDARGRVDLGRCGWPQEPAAQPGLF